jgi:coproporphyrinogen III oxidase
VMANGKVFEKAGVAVSVVYGSMPEEALRAATARGVNRAAVINSNARQGRDKDKIGFFACGISSVIHPRNPHAVGAPFAWLS